MMNVFSFEGFTIDSKSRHCIIEEHVFGRIEIL